MAAESVQANGRHDSAERRHGVRRGRERGCWVYIPAVELERAGFDPHGEPPYYRTWGHRRSLNAGTVMVALYPER